MVRYAGYDCTAEARLKTTTQGDHITGLSTDRPTAPLLSFPGQPLFVPQGVETIKGYLWLYEPASPALLPASGVSSDGQYANARPVRAW